MTFIEEIAFRQSLFWGSLTAALIIAALFAIVASWRGPSWWRTLFKALPLALLIFGSVANFAHPLVIAALVFSLFGDIALSRAGQRPFLIGLIGFGLAHVLYVVHFAGIGTGWPAFGPALALIGLALSTEFFLKPHTSDMLWPVRVYVVLITAMGLAALTLVDRDLALIGAMAFVISDLLLAIQLFRLNSASRLHVPISVALWALYILAQAGILLGAGFAQPLISL